MASEKVTQVMDLIKQMTVLELSELKKDYETTFDVTAAAPVAIAAPVGGGGGDAPAPEKDSFDVVLAEAGANKINVIKIVREITSLGLKEAKALVDEAPKPVKEGVLKDEAEELKKKLEEAGAKVELK